jgi:hypothetical protein
MNDEILVNPYTAVRLFAKTYLAFGNQVLTNSKYKITREAWIASMFLIALGQESKLQWWLTPVLKSDSPDFNCYSFSRSNDNSFTNRSMLKLEVFEWRKERDEKDFLEALKKIKLRKIVDPEITIVCYIRRSGLIPPAIELNFKLKALKPCVKDIWYLGDVSGDATTWRVTQLYPNTSAIDMNYDQILQTKETHSLLHGYRGKSDKLEFEPTGKKVLLTPEFQFITLFHLGGGRNYADSPR